MARLDRGDEKMTEIAERDDHEQEQRRRSGGPIQFWREVQAEGKKITWATRAETLISTIMVVIMVVIMAVFFFATDSLLHALVSLILGIGIQ
jgi:preprotein translocase subunit SecE